jgi:hypothetical protein
MFFKFAATSLDFFADSAKLWRFSSTPLNPLVKKASTYLIHFFAFSLKMFSLRIRLSHH